MVKITTIWWWNWQSNILSAFNNYFPEEIFISSIVSMSDDWRTTGELIRNFKKSFDLHLPPPWDLRKCFYSSSKSKYLIYFKNILENIFSSELQIKDFTILELFKLATTELFNNFWKEIKSEFSTATIKVDSYLPEEIKKDIELFLVKNSWPLFKYLQEKFWEYLNFVLPLSNSLKWHKFWNILMASIYYNLKNYDKMTDFMHEFLEVKWKIIPVTTERAFIKAILENWEIIETQDKISNDAEYTSKIVDFELMDCSKNAKHTNNVNNAIIEADYLIITPWDLFTSTISNFIIWWVKDSIKSSKAKIILIWNNTNKWWETWGFKIIDFIEQIEKYLWKKIDFFITNDKKITLIWDELENFKTNVSVQWWDFLYLTPEEEQKIKQKWTKIITSNLLDKNIYYKHDKENISKIIYELIKN